MNLHRTLSYSLMTAGAVASVNALLGRWQWDEANIHAAIMLDWDDAQAVAARAQNSGLPVDAPARLLALLGLYRANGATHLSIPELTLARLLAEGRLLPAEGADSDRVYVRAADTETGQLVAGELAARLPHLQVRQSRARNPLISFVGHLPTLAEVGLGFDPSHAALAQQTGLKPAARPLGYSWVQPAMIDRTLNQAAALGCNLVAVQGRLIPGHEFNMQTTVNAMRRHGLTYAYFNRSRHQKGDWFLAKNLAADGLVVLAHEFQPEEMLEDDLHTLAYRWANMAVEAGTRVCAVRFFRILHAADPLESVVYVHELSRALDAAGLLVDGYNGAVDLSPFRPARDNASLAAAGLSAAGAAGLAADLLPLPGPLKLLGTALAAAGLTALPFAEQWLGRRAAGQHHHDHHTHHHHDDDHAHHHHHDHPHDRARDTAYAPKGIALAAAAAFPAAAAACPPAGVVTALLHTWAVGQAGAAALTTAATETDTLLDIEQFRSYHLDWLLPLFLIGLSQKLKTRHSKLITLLFGLALTAFKQPDRDWLAALDREHRHAHTHHLSAFQRLLGDARLALWPRPLRKWTLLAPLGAALAVVLRRNGPAEASTAAAVVTAAGTAAALAGFRHGQRPLLTTVEGRAKAWAAGAVLAGLFAWLWERRQ